VGGGFGGLQATLGLRGAPLDVTLVDERNFHLFQPLTYQVATGALAAAEVTYPLRTIFRQDGNVRVLMAKVTDFDLTGRRVRLDPVAEAAPPRPRYLGYDTLIVAGGARYSYFGHDEWERLAPEVKSLESALTVRRRILGALEAAEPDLDADRDRGLLTFVVVGAGPTGVEMAGQIAEMAGTVVAREMKAIDPGRVRIVLVEASDRVLTAFPPSLSAKATASLERLGATPMVDRTVVAIDEEGVTVEAPDGARERIPARTVIWAAGVTASTLAGALGRLSGAEVDRAGRVLVEPNLALPGHSEVYALGDMVRVRGEDGKPMPLPGLAPVAMQQGRYVATVIRNGLAGRATPPFRYRDKGNLATIGRSHAVAHLRRLRLSGFVAWLAWLAVHLWYLIGFQNRLVVLVRWSFSFLARRYGARVAVGEPVTRPIADSAPHPVSATAISNRAQ
jgi:NADH dehydrogenase